MRRPPTRLLQCFAEWSHVVCSALSDVLLAARQDVLIDRDGGGWRSLPPLFPLQGPSDPPSPPSLLCWRPYFPPAELECARTEVATSKATQSTVEVVMPWAVWSSTTRASVVVAIGPSTIYRDSTVRSVKPTRRKSVTRMTATPQNLPEKE